MITNFEKMQITNTILEIIWGLCLWKIVTTSIELLNLSQPTNIAIYFFIFVVVTFSIYIYNERKLTPLYTQ